MAKKVKEQKAALGTLKSEFEEFFENRLESKAIEYEAATN